MDLDIIIMSAVIVAICILPIIILSRKSKLKRKHIKNVLNDLARTQSAELASHEICGQIAVGITKNDEAFLFYNKHEDETESKSCILLSDFKQCNLIKTSRSASSGNIGRLVLHFESIDKGKSDVSLEFFNATETFQLVGELQLVEKWKPIIDSAIEKQKVMRQKSELNTSRKRALNL